MAENMTNSEKQTNREFMSTSFGDEKASKMKELNASMTIRETSNDSYTNKLHNIGGGGQ